MAQLPGELKEPAPRSAVIHAAFDSSARVTQALAGIYFFKRGVWFWAPPRFLFLQDAEQAICLPSPPPASFLPQAQELVARCRQLVVIWVYEIHNLTPPPRVKENQAKHQGKVLSALKNPS